MTPTRWRPADRRASILQAALVLAQTDGLINLNRSTVAAAACVSPGLVSYYFGHAAGLRAEVMRAAIDGRVLRIIAEGLANRDVVALTAPVELRTAAFNSML